jgi:hypothetical protein
VQVGGRGLQCPLPEDLATTVYASVNGSTAVVPMQSITVMLEHSIGDALYVEHCAAGRVWERQKGCMCVCALGEEG